MSDLSKSLTVAHLSWATGAISAQSLICPVKSERKFANVFLLLQRTIDKNKNQKFKIRHNLNVKKKIVAILG